MKSMQTAVDAILKHIKECCGKLDPKQVDAAVQGLTSAERIFVAGAGRSEILARNFALRLQRLGLRAYIVGDVAPVITARDMLVAISGSGETDSVISIAESARKVGAKVLAVTSFPQSTLGKQADFVLHVAGREKPWERGSYVERMVHGEHEPPSPMGALFESACFILLEGLCAEILERKGAQTEWRK
ncbi:MAG: SIS domain-containing protein [Hadesarchaea archaeon]|nr:SIS domain-containing protein [Hadesarchaea archaeon]